MGDLHCIAGVDFICGNRLYLACIAGVYRHARAFNVFTGRDLEREYYSYLLWN